MDEVEIDIRSMCDDKEFLPALSMMRTINQFHIDRYKFAIETFTETRAALRAELGLKDEAETSR